METATRRAFLRGSSVVVAWLGVEAVRVGPVAGQPVTTPLELASATMAAGQRRIELGPSPVTVTLALAGGSRGRLREAIGPGGPGRVSLELEGIEFEKHPETHAEIYLNLPPGAPPDRRSIRFLGSLHFLGPGRPAGGPPPAGPAGGSETYDITTLLKTLIARGLWNDDRLTVTFVLARPSPVGGKPALIPADARVRIGRVTISLQ
jgi:hypothetical protein